ncbi:MAG TPA: acyl-CoA dehydrogenase family protein [Steroidobacter sp.]|nr:acyl-CoA dehydrogenase family protein [Steroidobacter sp.]
MTEPFVQEPPWLGNVYADDAFLRSYLRRKLPSDVLEAIEPDLQELGKLSGGELYALQLADRLNEPELTQWDAWGNRIDQVIVSPLWRRAAEIAAQKGLVAIPYEQAHGRYSRIHQFAAVYLFHPSSDVYTCPLAMTDGAARTLIAAQDHALIKRALPRLTNRDPAQAWTSGQWMTEAVGGSDVGASTTRALEQDGSWRLYGKKWFTSAVTANMALTLARPEGNRTGGAGLAMFYVEVRDQSGGLNGLRIERLKDKLGTRKVPTAELTLDGAIARLVGEPRNGTQRIEPMLVVTRTWNSVTSVSFMRRALTLARSYAARRRAFGARLEQLSLHVDTLADLEAETRAAFLLAFELVELMGRFEAKEIGDDQRALLRLITPIAKLLTAKQAVKAVSECIEAFGGAGYVEDTGLPMLMRDAQVLPIWEGTTNVLSLDLILRSELGRALPALRARIESCVGQVRDQLLAACGKQALSALAHAEEFIRRQPDSRLLQANARRFAMTLGRALQLALLTEHGHWELENSGSRTGVAAAVRFAAKPVDVLVEFDPKDAESLLG